MRYNAPPGSVDPNASYVTGNPVTKTKGSPVPSEAVEYPQREIVNTILAAGLIPDNTDLTQLKMAILLLARDVALTNKYDVGEFYYFRHPTLKTGFAPMQGGKISGSYQGKKITDYPIWQYLQTSEGQLLCKTESEWQAMTVATWATLADGSKVGWNGIGGAPFFVQDLSAGTLRMPDVRGMHIEAAGFDSLGVGGAQGDGERNKTGSVAFFAREAPPTGTYAQVSEVTGIFALGETGPTSVTPFNTGLNWTGALRAKFATSRVAPTAAKNQPRAWGALACAYLGTPAS